MATIKLYLDIRTKKSDGTSSLKIAVTHDRKVRYIALGIYLAPDQWDEDAGRVRPKHPQSARLNAIIAQMRASAEMAVVETSTRGRVDVAVLREAVVAAIFPDKAEKNDDRKSVASVFAWFAAMKKDSTRLTYERTLNHIKAYDDKWDRLRFEDITRSWLMEFDSHMARTAPSPNSRAIHMRNLRAVINFAIDEGITVNYPFRRFRIKTIKTAKRALSIDALRSLMRFGAEEWQRPYLDFFKLSFMLVGINPIDLLNLTPDQLRGGRIEYNRSKTSRLYSIKVEPEAMALIESMRGDKHLINVMDTRTDYLQYVRQVDHALRTLGTTHTNGRRREGEPAFPGLTLYWARHSWATVARSIGISVDDIALALGHGDGHALTHIYIDESLHRIDEANRRVLDWVLR